MLRQSMFLLLVVLHSGTVSVNWAQVGNAMLVGRVTDPTAGVVAAAEVQIKRLSTNAVSYTHLDVYKRQAQKTPVAGPKTHSWPPNSAWRIAK